MLSTIPIQSTRHPNNSSNYTYQIMIINNTIITLMIGVMVFSKTITDNNDDCNINHVGNKNIMADHHHQQQQSKLLKPDKIAAISK